MNKADDELFSTFVKKILNLNRSIRWVGIANQRGIIIKETYREELTPLLTSEENLEYAANTIARHKERIKYEPKIGKLEYTLVKYERVNRIMIPLNNNNNYLLFSLDVEQIDYDNIIKKNIIPFVEGQEVSE
ncbi:MAG TPA: hypothetical protein VFD60_01125 [Nitrososphaeraceae archaeon]|jgi:hypothetical protein|nr:hypothetical protein [Nitrososphaeraceae archaeon]